MLVQVCLQVLRGYRMTQQVPLTELAPRGPGDVQLGPGLQALREYLDAELPTELDQYVDDPRRLSGPALRREHQPVDLEQVQRQYPQVAQ